jgi:hypothetical protein
MSLEAVAWSLRQKLDDPTAKLILISLADHQNPSTKECFPSRGRLAEAGCCSESTVKRKLAWLVEQGWIIVKPRYCQSGRQTSNAYEIVFDRKQPENGGGQSEPLPPAEGGGEGINLNPTRGSQPCTPHSLTVIGTKRARDAREASPLAASEVRDRRKEIGSAMKGLAQSLRANCPGRSQSGARHGDKPPGKRADANKPPRAFAVIRNDQSGAEDDGR